MRATAVHHVSINVDDVSAALDFYTNVLGLVQHDGIARRNLQEGLAPGADAHRDAHLDATPAQLVDRRVEVVDAQREMTSRVKTELAVGRKMDVPGWRRIPDARAIAKRDRPLELLEAEGLSVELSSSGFLARRIEHLRVMQGNPHKSESRRAEMPCFSRFSWATICSARRRC
jgi:catechol 2,3-dioxygenase-like lactoylglutathione lyase family enzyme